MCRKNGGYWFAIALGFILILASITPVVDLDDNDIKSTVIMSEPERCGFLGGTPHAPIVIVGDTDFGDRALAEGWPGDGSAETPYIIKGLDIDLGGEAGHGITINNTRVHFVIRDSNLTGASVLPGSGIYLNDVENGVLINNTCTNNTYGIYLSDSDFNIVSDSTCTSDLHGIYLSGSLYNTVANNTCSSNSGIDIYLSSSSSNTVSNNTCTSTTDYGISVEISSSFNDIQWNAFVGGPTNGYDAGSGNIFDHNFWSEYAGTDANGDGFGDTPYTFTSNSDPHPLMYFPFAPDWLHLPVDQVIEFGNVFEYPLEFITTALTAPYDLSVDDSVNFAADYNDTITSKTALPVGVYPLQVVATNIYGYKTEGAFTLTVEDTTPPLITSPEDITYTKGEGDYEIAWTMSDLSPTSYRVLLDGTELTSSAENSTSTSFSMTLEDKDPGVYNYSMVAEDIWGNMAMDTVIVTVLPIPFLEVLLPWLFVGAVAVIALVVIVFLLQKRKSS